MIKKLLALMLALFASIAMAAVDANSADATQLDSVKGIGPALSAKIVEARKAGPFKDWQDLITRVSGVGEKNAAKMSAAGLTVNGAAMTGAPAATAQAARTSPPAIVPPPPVAAPKMPAAQAPKVSTAPAMPLKKTADSPATTSVPVTAPAADKEAKAAAKAASKAEKAAAKKAAAEAKKADKEAKKAAKAAAAASK